MKRLLAICILAGLAAMPAAAQQTPPTQSQAVSHGDTTGTKSGTVARSSTSTSKTTTKKDTAQKKSSTATKPATMTTAPAPK